MFNEASTFFEESALSDEVLSTLKSIVSALTAEFNDCQDLDKQLRNAVLVEVDEDDQLDTFFDAVSDVTATNRGKIAKLEFFMSKFEKKRTTTPELLSSTKNSALQSKLPDYNFQYLTLKSRNCLVFGIDLNLKLEIYRTCPIRKNSCISLVI